MSQSSVSYAANKLQQALGMALLAIDGRKARLTTAGEELLQQVRPLLMGFSSVETQAELLSHGGETQLSLAVDSAYPDALLFAALAAFQQKHRAVRLHLRQGIRLSAEMALEHMGAQLCIATQAPERHPSEPFFEVELLAVAHSKHPLHAMGNPLTHQHLAEHVLVQIADVGAGAPLPTMIEGCETWTVNTIHAALCAVQQGTCFGWLPRELIQDLLDSGDLKLLPLLSGTRRVTHLFLSQRNDLPTRSVAFALIRALKHQIGKAPKNWGSGRSRKSEQVKR